MSDEAEQERPQNPDTDVIRVKDLAARIQVHFSDFLLIVRTKDGMAWKHSDPTWAIGAACRYEALMADNTLIEHLENRAAEDGE